MDADEHALCSDLLAEERLERARGPEEVLDALWARESDRARHERPAASASRQLAAPSSRRRDVG